MNDSNTIQTLIIQKTRIPTIRCGLSQAFINKENVTGHKHAFSQSFQPTEIRLDQFVKHITNGKAWTQGYFHNNGRRKDAFISAQTFALDLDDRVGVAAALSEKVIRDHALLVHPSPSSTPEHPKTRVIFVLDTFITNADEWERLQRGLIEYFAHLRPDPACKDCARMFYGSDKSGAYCNLKAILPIATVKDLIDTLPIIKPQTKTKKTPKTQDPLMSLPTPSGGQLSEQLVYDVENALGVVNSPVNSYGFTIKACMCPVRHHEHDLKTPAAFWNPNIRALKCFKCGMTYNTHQVAEALGFDVSAYYSKSSVWERISRLNTDIGTSAEDTLFPFSADMTVNLRYISTLQIENFVRSRAVLVKSPIGTGKTEAATNLIEHLGKILGRPPKVLALTHRQALADDLARRLSQNKGGHTFECYKGLEAADLRRISNLVICYDSVWKLATVGERLPQYDLIIIDEIEQFHQHLGGDTMRGSEPERAYRILRQLVKEIPHFLGMDAHASNISRDWLSYLLGGNEHVTCIYNQYRAVKGELILHENKDTAINHALHLARLDEGIVVIPTNSRSMAKKLYYIFSEALGEEAVQIIHGGNSNDHEIQNFIRNINEEIKKYKVLIYSPSLGTGVDITTQVRAVVGVFSLQPLAPADMHQMLGRCRNVQERHVWVQNTHKNLETDWQAIYQRHELSAVNTGFLCDFNEFGILAVNDIQKAMLKLLSLLEATRNRTMCSPLYNFALMARREGYQLNFKKGVDDLMKETLKQATEEIEAQEKEEILNATPVSHEEFEQHRFADSQTPEIVAGYNRYKIEDSVGQQITSQIYDDLGTSKKRDKLRRFTDLTEDEAILKHYDQQEAQSQTLLIKRQHRTLCRQLILNALEGVWGVAPEGIYTTLENATKVAVTAEEIAPGITPLIKEENSKLLSYMGWRSDQSHNPVAILRWLLGQIGLELTSKQLMVNGERFRVYSINESSLLRMQKYAASRRIHLQKKRSVHTI